MQYIQFVYKLPSSLVTLASEEFKGFSDNRVIGYMRSNDTGFLRHCYMYIVCEMETNNGVTINKNPIAIVARTEIAALDMFFKVTGKTNGTVHSIVETDCQNIMVEPTGETINI